MGMSEKKYRACLIGVVILMVVLGIFIWMKYQKSGGTPDEATLVKHCVDGINRQKGCVKGIWDSRKLSI